MNKTLRIVITVLLAILAAKLVFKLLHLFGLIFSSLLGLLIFAVAVFVIYRIIGNFAKQSQEQN